jgi:spoIIIJ-associated protein
MSTDVTERISAFVTELTTTLGLSLEPDVEEGPESIWINLRGDGGEVLVKRKGEALDALQHLTNAVFRSDVDGDRRIVVDCMGFRRAKDLELRHMARLLADKVRRTGQSEEIGPLNPYERRIVHLEVARDADVTSESIGDAFLKTIIISLKTSAKSV